jgi:hypothetical protein
MDPRNSTPTWRSKNPSSSTAPAWARPALVGDAELTPVRGQLVFVPPDDRVDHLTIGGGDGVLYMFPGPTVREHARISKEMRVCCGISAGR